MAVWRRWALVGAITFGVVGLVFVRGAGTAMAAPCTGSPTIAWTGEVGTSWLDPGNWKETTSTTHRLPDPTDDVCVDINTAGGISLSGGSATVNSLNVTNTGSTVQVAASGALTLNGSVNSSIATAFTNDGALAVQAGTLTFTATNGTSNGSVTVASGATLSFPSGSATYSGTASITGAGQMTVSGAQVTVSSGATFAVTTLLVSSGTLTLHADSSLGAITLSGSGAVLGSGNMTVGSALTMAGTSAVTLGGTGTTTIASGATATLTTTNAVVLARPLSVVSGASLTVGGNGSVAGTGGSIANAGTMSVTGNSSISVPITNTATGTLAKSSAATTVFSNGFLNDGATSITTGTLQLSGTNGTSNGSITVASGALLTFTGGSATYSGTASITGAGQMTVAGANPITLASGMTYGLNAFQVSSGTLTLNGPFSIPTVNLTGSGVLNGSGNLTVTSALTAGGTSAVTLGGTGTTTIASGATATLTTTNAVVLARPLSVVSGASLTVGGNGSVAGTGGSIANAGTMSVTGNSSISVPITNTATGTLAKSSAATTVFSNGFLNDGATSITTGTLQLSGTNGTSNGSITVASGALLTFTGGSATYSGTASITGAGQMTVAGANPITLASGMTYGLNAFQVSSGTLTLNGPFSIPTVNLTGSGVLNGSGNLTVTSALTAGGTSAVTLGGTGTTTIASGATATLTTTNAVVLARPLSVVSGASLTVGGNGSVAGTGGSIANAGTMSVTGNSSISVPITNTATGTLAKSSAATTVFSNGFLNDGATSITTGTLQLSGTNGTSNGSITVASGALLTFTGGSATYSGTASITGAGQMTVAGANPITLASGMTYGLNAFQVSSGTLTLNGPFSIPTVNLTGSGVLNGSGNLTVTSALTAGGTSAVTLGGTGTTTIASGATATLTTTNAVVLARPLSVVSGASLTVGGNGSVAGTGGSIANAGTMSVTGNSSISVPITNTATGTLAKSSAGTTVFSGAFSNSGILTASNGTLNLTGTFANYNQTTDVLTGGTYSVAGTLRFTGADIVTNQATIVLDGPAALIRDTVNNDAFRDLTTNGSSGSLTVTNGATLTLPKALASSGALVVGPSATLGAPGVTLNAGTLSGVGTVAAPVTNVGGTVSPGTSPGSLSITGSYTQNAGGSLPIEIGGTTAGTGYDQLNVSGAATLNGTLTLSTVGPFVPAVGQTFTILSYASHTGCFTTVNGIDLSIYGPGLFYDVSCGATSAVVTVKQPQASIDDVTVTEGDSGTQTATFSVSLTTGHPTLPLSLDYATADGTAAAPADYIGKTGTLTWAAGDGTSKTVSVDVKGDTMDEFDETFTVGLSNPSNMIIVDGSGLGTITDDDPPPTATIDDVTQTEGDSGTTALTFTVSLSAPSGKPISIDYATADGSAISPSDYAAASGTLSFAPGDVSKPVTVNVAGDTLDEFDETLTVGLSNPSNVVILDGSGLGTITDDDPPPSVSIDDVSHNEGDSGTTAYSFTVSLSAPSGKPISVDYATANGTAVAPADYASATGTLSFDPGDTSKPVTVNVNGDALNEFDETFTVGLSNLTNVGAGDLQGQGTITNDDPLPTVSIDDVSQNEGDSGTTAFTFTVSLSAPSGKPISVDYATADGTAVAPTDYTAKTGTLNFAAGDTSKTVTVNAKGDTTVEPDETFVVNLSNLTNVGAGDVQGQGTIVNDDVAVAPIVTGYNVAAATVGKKITITGSHFTGATSVGFTKAGGGTVNGTALKVVSDTTITVKVPNLATTGVVSVTNPGGTGVGPVLKIKSTVTGFTPTHGTSGVTGPVIITGNAFTGATKVKFGTKTAVFTVDNDGQITVTKVPSGLASGSDVFITVTTAGGNGKSKTTFHID